MTYQCKQCSKEVHQVRLDDERKSFVCEKCYWQKTKEVVKSKNNGKLSGTA